MPHRTASASERRTLPPSVAVSAVALSLAPPADAQRGDTPGAPATPAGPSLWLPLVRRIRQPFLGDWALPGGPIAWNETLVDTALRTLEDAAGATPDYIEQLYTFGSRERSARAQRVVSIAYWALFADRAGGAPAAGVAIAENAPASDRASGPEPVAPERPRAWDEPAPVADETAAEQRDARAEAQQNVAWFPVDALPPLAFDHAEIIATALARLRAKTGYAALAHRFLGPEFTLSRLRAVHEAIRGGAVDPANFRRQVLADDRLIDTGRQETGGKHRPARLYRFRADDELAVGAATPEPPRPPRNPS